MQERKIRNGPSGSRYDRERSIRIVALVVAITAAMTLTAVPTARAQAFTLLYTFDGSGSGGGSPLAPLIGNSQGDLLGVAAEGGDSGHGVFFKLNSGGRETVLHGFKDTGGADPEGQVARDAAGNFYGTTAGGGASGAGTI